MVDLEAATMFPLLPLSQAPDNSISVKPFITVVGPNEFLILSWNGATTMGVFITGDGEPVRGTLEWPSHPEAICECEISTREMMTGSADDMGQPDDPKGRVRQSVIS